MRILCVEDDADSREILTMFLELEGYEVVTAVNSAEGLKLARQDGLAAIILDNCMERGSGVDLCKQIRQFDSHTPILFYSGAVYQTDAQQAMAAGAQVYLTKPTDFKVIVETIGELIRDPGRLSAGEPQSDATCSLH